MIIVSSSALSQDKIVGYKVQNTDLTKDLTMQRIEAEVAVSVSDLKKNPTAVVESADGHAVAVLNHNRVMAYMVPAGTYEAMIDALDDQALVDLVQKRAGERGIPVTLDDL
ncbi:type II toxin-antitoxin system Phd/YefM family antitoxin [Rhizobium sp. SSA_523]|nr:type II toxin-antitoxin system Phd/YefM family antitoxin [Rhizobium sp. SSA_523]MCO5730535.1 type II toxin-antitoxin system Phd/YefM family antitoxin [Rhizobium sp. SSA_523]WKC25574.1 type II toxin-antitoxin system Phd/YefM family antitoxin [Rhizobium sp. SSA_523]